MSIQAWWKQSIKKEEFVLHFILALHILHYKISNNSDSNW